MTNILTELRICACTSYPETNDLMRAAANRIEALEAEVARLRGALEPFAQAARSIDVDPPSDYEPSHGRGSVTAGDLRRARAALAGDAG